MRQPWAERQLSYPLQGGEGAVEGISWTIRMLRGAAWLAAWVLAAMPARFVVGQVPFDREPINYSSTAARDAVSELQRRLDEGEAKLEFTPARGYLESVLRELGVSPSSQMLVFSKTSFQQRRISPWTPRALYFNDNVYVGWVPEGDVVEVSAVDPQLGAVFYTLSQDSAEAPQFIRDKGNCLTCHASSRTQGVPGHLVRSVYPSASGLPHFGSGTFRTNHSSPLRERWGGWYVTGRHGKQRHMGNVVARERDRPESLDVEQGANVTDLASRTRIDAYLSPHSDIVALLVLEHQTDMHNLIACANFEARRALYDAAIMNKMLDREPDYQSESTQRRLASAAERLVKYMLFADEARLTDRIQGVSNFAEHFASLGPHDQQGRSLRQFDLQRRIFKYPCSYLIYSKAFREMPEPVKELVYRRLWAVLRGEDQDEAFAHLSSDDRQAILEILGETHADLPDYWKTSG